MPSPEHGMMKIRSDHIGRFAVTVVTIVVGAAVVGCGSTNENTGMNPDNVRDFATRYTAAWCSQNPASVAAFFADDGSLTVNDGEPAVGTEAITGVANGFMTAFPDMVILMDDVIIVGEGVEYHWTLVGTNTGPVGTGNRVRISGYEEWRINSDGRIAESKGHFDGEEYQRQLEEGY
jgi:uncharacterized protein (TIGR02246 family)